MQVLLVTISPVAIQGIAELLPDGRVRSLRDGRVAAVQAEQRLIPVAELRQVLDLYINGGDTAALRRKRDEDFHTRKMD